MQPQFWHQFLFYSKVAGGASTFAGAGYGAIRWLAITYKKLSTIGENVVSISTNHLPHLQSSLDAHTEALRGIKSDFKEMDAKVDGLSDRVDDTKKSVDGLSTAFVQHLENASKEFAKRKKR